MYFVEHVLGIIILAHLDCVHLCHALLTSGLIESLEFLLESIEDVPGSPVLPSCGDGAADDGG